MSDRYRHHQTGLESPAVDVIEIVPDDATDLAQPLRAVNVAQSGYLRLTTTGGSTARLYVAAGTAFPVRARRVFATGTDAQGIVGLI